LEEVVQRLLGLPRRFVMVLLERDATLGGKVSLDPTISRRQLLVATGAGALFALRPSGANARRLASLLVPDDVVLRWNEAFLQGVRDSRLGPPMVSRALAVAHTCIYDAWSAYDRTAVGTQFGAHLRRPPRERSLENKV